MRIGFIGLGKLGLPCLLGIEQHNHTVFGVDPSPLTKQIIDTKTLAYIEAGAQECLNKSQVFLTDYEYLVREADLLFMAVQTPHDLMYEGITPIPETRADFDYSYLCEAVTLLCQEMKQQNVEKDVVIISTVLPGTMQKYIRPIINEYGLESKLHLVYNPFFIAMGTALHDFLNPEFVLMGSDDSETAERVKAFYKTIHNRPIYSTTVENAELIKVAYNTYIGMKIVFANTMMEICHKTPNTNCDAVSEALSYATDRLMSPKYLQGGMGDGGGCHPRDGIALSWLAQQLSLSHDFFFDVMSAREDQTQWLANLILEHKGDLPVVLMGWSFKPNTNIDVGSPARLLSHYLNEKGINHEVYDPHANIGQIPTKKALYFLSTRHEDWKEFQFPAGSVILDPFRFLKHNLLIDNCKYIPIGVHE